VGTASSGDPFAPAYNLMDAIQMKHLEMAQQVAAYKEMVEELEEHRDADAIRIARALPGARYLVNETFVREAWLKLQVELAALFPEPPASEATAAAEDLTDR
jgi:hypothetical protein